MKEAGKTEAGKKHHEEESPPEAGKKPEEEESTPLPKKRMGPKASPRRVSAFTMFQRDQHQVLKVSSPESSFAERVSNVICDLTLYIISDN